MRICLLARDVSSLQGGGIARYGIEIYKALKNCDIDIYSPSFTRDIDAFGSFKNVIFSDLVYPLLFILKNKNRYDIFHATFPQQALVFPFIKNRIKITTFHDLGPFLPDTEKTSSIIDDIWRIYAKLVFKIAARFSTHIVCVSSQTKEELIGLLKVDSKKITVINHGVSELFDYRRNRKDDILTIGYIGDLKRRKNVDILIKSICIIKRKYPDINVRLLICGRKLYEYEKLIKIVEYLNVVDNVEFKGFVPEENIQNVYNEFYILGFLSSYEGFALPIIEAQRCGIPVIILKDVKIPEEVCKCTIRCKDENDIAENCKKLFFEKSIYDDISMKGKKYSEIFMWNYSAEKLIKLYSTLVAKNEKI